MLTSFLHSCNRIAVAATVGLFAAGALVLAGTSGAALTHRTLTHSTLTHGTAGDHVQTASGAPTNAPTGAFGWD